MLSGSSTFYECHALFGTRGMCHVHKGIEGVMPYSVHEVCVMYTKG